jgi:hypothetical protein
MAEIIELIAADHLHIVRWQVRLADLCRHRGEPGCAPELAATWDTLAALIDLHMDGQIRGRYQAPPPRIPTCQLRQAQPAATVPRLADPAFAPLACACPACTRELDPVPDAAGHATAPAPGSRPAPPSGPQLTPVTRAPEASWGR